MVQTNTKALIVKLLLFISLLVVVKIIILVQMPLEKQTYTQTPHFQLKQAHGDYNLEDMFGRNEVLKTFYNVTIQTPGIILAIKGGIGNQLFEYACSYALAQKKNWPLYINYRLSFDSSKSRQFKANMREFALDKFQIPLDNFIQIGSTKFPPGEPLRVFDEDLLHGSLNQSYKFMQLAGPSYCQSENYWKDYKDEIKTFFQPRPESVNLTKLATIISMIQKHESVAVHVRRGDFLKSTGYFVPTTYQRRAIPLMVDILNTSRKVENPVFFVFSDDVQYTKNKFKDFARKYRFVHVSDIGNTTSMEDFYLLSICKHLIVPNSTFSWWATYLNKNKNKIVIASAFNPLFWRLWEANKKTKEFYRHLYGKMFHPKSWIIMDPFSGGLTTDSKSVYRTVF